MKYVFYEICNTVHNLADCIGITTTSFSSSAVGLLQSQNVIDLSNHFVQKLCMFDYYCQNEKNIQSRFILSSDTEDEM